MLLHTLNDYPCIVNIALICTGKPGNPGDLLYCCSLEANPQDLRGVPVPPSLSALPATEETLRKFCVCQLVFFRLVLLCHLRCISISVPPQILSLIAPGRW